MNRTKIHAAGRAKRECHKCRDGMRGHLDVVAKLIGTLCDQQYVAVWSPIFFYLEDGFESLL
jgi:hypothetical protein